MWNLQNSTLLLWYDMSKYLAAIFFVIFSVCSLLSYIPQIVKILRTKKSEDISITSWVLYLVNCGCFIAYSYLIDEAALLLSSWVELTLILITLVLTVKYRDKEV